jgi:hypothetical protein
MGEMARFAVVALMFGCTSPQPMRRAITNGAADSGDAAVVQLVGEAGNLVCSGVVIGKHNVLTAAHCLAGTFVVMVGEDAMQISRADAHPDFDSLSLDHDLAVLTLRQPAAVTPFTVDDAAPMVGQTFAVVGFGSTAAAVEDEGERRRGTAQVTAVGRLDFTAAAAPSQPCKGDSGGPALFTDGVVGGVASHGDSGCSDHAIFARIDRAFIDAVQLAEGSATVGERCYFDEQCQSGPCLIAGDEPQRSFCSQPCQKDGDCPTAMSCAADGCRHRLPSPGAFGSSCAMPSDCVSATCEGMMCTRRCVPTGKDCPSGFVCQNARGIDFFCARAAPDPGGCSLGGRTSFHWWWAALLWLFDRHLRRRRHHLLRHFSVGPIHRQQ